MPIKREKVASLLEFVKIDKFYVVCHFRCKVTNKTIISTVPFEPYTGKIEISWQDMLLHPIDSYNKYYHTPITIYNHDNRNTIVLKAFEKVAKYFEWSDSYNSYVYTAKQGFNVEQRAS